MIFYREQLAESICHESSAAHKVVEKYVHVHWVLYVEHCTLSTIQNVCWIIFASKRFADCSLKLMHIKLIV